MDYQVWIKREFGEEWSREDCGDLGAAKRRILDASKQGEKAALTVEVPFSLELKVGEPGGEVKKKPAKKASPGDKTPGEEGKGEADKDPAE